MFAFYLQKISINLVWTYKQNKILFVITNLFKVIQVNDHVKYYNVKMQNEKYKKFLQVGLDYFWATTSLTCMIFWRW